MLTRREKRWLIYRRKGYCRIWCKPHSVCFYMPSKYCPTSASFDDYREAAEFEARVAAKLAKYAGRNVDVDQCSTCPAMDKNCHWGVRLSCEELMLQAARLAVEEEMDADKK